MTALPHTLVLGGARSGKSRYAEGLVIASGLERIYIATAQAWDEEMTIRITEHRRRRAEQGWRTVEEPLDLAATLVRETGAGHAVLVDCLTLWLNNVMLGGNDVDAAVGRLIDQLPSLPGAVVLVSNEVGLCIVPDTALGRRFRDAQGRLNQSLAATVPRVVFVTAGLPVVLKGAP
ncbi:MAG: bifunctional adenosylcobinamide kinase/adenosylcobinamide-phosphate guanylyltransferase [Rhodospirillales bacterium]|nr:bifunctional adenosylcobinamide kinase/adenosylcobinamide-phosphate guanylyltransferase [Rhodospirillales bacterium]